MILPAAISVAPGTFLAIVFATAVAGTIAATVRVGGLGVPAVVLELFAGVLLGPQVAGLHVTPSIEFFSDLGLGLLFYFAGYEIDPLRIEGKPLELASSDGRSRWRSRTRLAARWRPPASCCRCSTRARRWRRRRSGR